VGKPEGKRPLGKPRRNYVNNIKMDLGEIEWDGLDWIVLAQDSDQWRGRMPVIFDGELNSKKVEFLLKFDFISVCETLLRRFCLLL
jgi:hypothetical protein